MTHNSDAVCQYRVATPRDCTFHLSDWDVLARSWFPVARADELKDRPIKARLLDVDLVVYRTGGIPRARPVFSPWHCAQLGLGRGRRYRVPLSRLQIRPRRALRGRARPSRHGDTAQAPHCYVPGSGALPAKLPLCLLTRNMQNRRIIDRLFVAGGAGIPKVAVETDSVLTLVAHVRSGEWSSVFPHSFLGLLGRNDATFGGLRVVPLVEPEAEQAVGLVVSERDPLSPLARALVDVAQQFAMSGALGQTLFKQAS